jgi:C4-dicarboxylate transporter DctM subunit
MLYDDMIRIGYPKDRTAGLLVVSGGLGPIIPPSIIMVVYGTITGASITNMFTSGLFIGILIVLVLMIVVIIYANREKWPKTEKKISVKELSVSFLKAIPALMLPIIILGGIYSGTLTATEASAAAVVWSLIAGMFIYREVSIKDIPGILLDSAKSASIILFIIGTSTSFSWLFTFSGISKQLVSFVVNMNLNPTMFCFVIAILLLIFGTFLEGIAIAVLLVPVLWPIAHSLGIDIVHFGMIVCVSNVIGTMTPPVAVNIFAATSVSKLSIGQIAKGQIPFFIGYVAVFLLVVFFPVLSRILL